MAGSIVQGQINEGAAASTTIDSVSAWTVTAGNFIHVVTQTDTPDTVSITKVSGTATIGTPVEVVSSSAPTITDEGTVTVVPVTGSGTLTLRATFGSSQANRQLLELEVTGVTGLIDSGTPANSGSAIGDSGVNPTSTLTVNAVTSPAFGVSVGIDYQGGTPSVGTGWTNYNTFGSVVNFIRVQVQEFTSTGNKTANFGNTGLDITNTNMVIYAEAQPPSISAGPANQTVYAGQQASYSVTASGTGTLHYQWKDDGVNVGTDASTYAPTVSLSDDRSLITVTVTDDNGSTTSNPAWLFVLPAASSAWIRA